LHSEDSFLDYFANSLPNELRIDAAGDGEGKERGHCAAAREAVRVACLEPVEGDEAVFGKRNQVELAKTIQEPNAYR
jgi:hypothetical protein